MTKLTTASSPIWSVPEKASVVSSYGERSVMITSDTDSHFYVTYGKASGNFSVPPTHSSFNFNPAGLIEVEIEYSASPNIDASFVVVEYTATSRRSHSYKEPHFHHLVGPETELVTLATRLKGKGIITLGGIRAVQHASIRGWEKSVPVRAGESVSVVLHAYTFEDLSPGSALVAVEFFDGRGDVVLPEVDAAINPRVGAYKYIDFGSSDDPAETEFSVAAPVDAETALFKLIPWKSDAVYLAGEPRIEVSNGRTNELGEESIASFVSSIPLDDTLIVLYTTAPPLGHPTLALRPNRLTKEYLGLGCWVVFFPFSRVAPGKEVQGNRVRQYSRDDIGEFLTAASARPGKNNVFICSSFPDIVAVGAVDLLKLQGWSTVYEVRDDMEEFNRVGYSKWFHPQLEGRVANSVDTVITVSPRLAKKMDVLCNKSDHATVIPNAVDQTFIDQAIENRGGESYRARSGSEIVGYLGHLTPSWFDWRLLISAAEELPSVTFEIIGHGMPDNLDLPANVIHLGPKTHDEFRDISRRWKVGIIPFKPSTLTYAVDPNKIYEYLAVGLRTVTARMGAVESCPSTWIYDRSADFVSCLSAALTSPFDQNEILEIEKFLASSSWGKRAEAMLETIGVKND